MKTQNAIAAVHLPPREKRCGAGLEIKVSLTRALLAWEVEVLKKSFPQFRVLTISADAIESTGQTANGEWVQVLEVPCYDHRQHTQWSMAGRIGVALTARQFAVRFR